MKSAIADCFSVVDVFAMYQAFVIGQADGWDVLSCFQEYLSHK
jgi:hypothetical protein